MTPTIHTTAFPTAKPRFGGVLRLLSGRSSGLMLSLAGKSWNPIFSVVEHVGRRSGRRYATPVAARRLADGFVISLAFGAHADWYRNLLASGAGTIRWRGHAYQVRTAGRIDVGAGLSAFHPIQRFFLRLGRIDGYVQLTDIAH